MPNTPPSAAQVPLAVRKTWPKLSEQLSSLFPVSPDRCQRCGSDVSDAEPASSVRLRRRWIEHDEWERPTATVVVLCKPCSERLIAPHPRLYAEIPTHKPVPGTMELCVACIHRHRLRCLHPRAKANGGSGVAVIFEPPMRAFMDGTRGGRRTGWIAEIYPAAPRSCDGREPTSSQACANESTTSPVTASDAKACPAGDAEYQAALTVDVATGSLSMAASPSESLTEDDHQSREATDD